MRKKQKNKLLLALGVGVGAYVLLQLVQGQSRTYKNTNLPQQYPPNYPPQNQKGKGVQTAVEIVGAAANLATTLFGKGGPFAKNKTA